MYTTLNTSLNTQLLQDCTTFELLPSLHSSIHCVHLNMGLNVCGKEYANYIAPSRSKLYSCVLKRILPFPFSDRLFFFFYYFCNRELQTDSSTLRLFIILNLNALHAVMKSEYFVQKYAIWNCTFISNSVYEMPVLLTLAPLMLLTIQFIWRLKYMEKSLERM